MDEQRTPTRPIGWWIKEADRRLDARFDTALANTGVDRRGWQVLSTLAIAPTAEAVLIESLAAFDTAQVVHGVVGDLQERGWVEEGEGSLRLTPQGILEHAELARRVDGVRRRVRDALPQDDYVTLVRLLARLTESL